MSITSTYNIIFQKY